MKKLLVFVLIAILCVATLAFTACEEAVFTAKDMMVFCNDSITTDPLQTMFNIDIDADLYSVAFHNVPGDKVTIDFTQHEKCKVTKRIENNTLYIEQTSQPLTVYVGGTLCLVVGIPESWVGYNLVADISVGTLCIENSKASNIDVEISTGGAVITAENANNVTLESDTGAISFTGKAKVLETDVDTGAVKLSGQADKVIAHTDTGAIKVDMLATNLELSSNTGSIVFTVGNNKSIKVQNDTGSVRGTIDGVKSQYTIAVDVDTGSCNVQDQMGTGTNYMKIDVDTGSVKITFKQ